MVCYCHVFLLLCSLDCWNNPKQKPKTKTQNKSFCFLFQATDGDEPGTNNSIVHYSIDQTPSYAAHYFDINPVSGELLINKSLNYEYVIAQNNGNPCFDLGVTAKDLGQPSLSNSTHVTVCVEDDNDVAPTFTRSTFSGSVAENSIEGLYLHDC